jgi:hypothetical protein
LQAAGRFWGFWGFWFWNLGVFGFLWNNGLREAVVTVVVFVLSTFCIQAPITSYKLQNGMSTKIMLNV